MGFPFYFAGPIDKALAGGFIPKATPVPAGKSGPMQGPATLGEAMAGGPFNELFGTGKGAIKGRTITTKPDGSKIEAISYNTPSMEPFSPQAVLDMAGQADRGRAIPSSSALPAPNPVAVPETPPINANVSFGNKLLAGLSDPGVYGMLGQIGGAIGGGPESFAGRLGAVATNQARGQAYNRLLASQMAGGGAPPPATPFGVGSSGLSPLAVGLLSPEEQSAAAEEGRRATMMPSEIAYREALARGVETPEQMLNRQLMVELAGQRPAAHNQGSFQTLEVGPDGKRTPGVSHRWLIDDISGEPIKYQGPVGATHAPQAAGGGADETRQWYQKAVDEAKMQVQREASQYGKVQTDAFGNVTGIEWTDPDAPRRYDELYFRRLADAIKRFQSINLSGTPLIPQGFEVPFQQVAPAQGVAVKKDLQLE